MATNVSSQPRDWKTLYQLAILELDPMKLLGRIYEARLAIIDQLEVRPYSEQQELNDALSGLHVIYQEYERKVQRFGEQRKAG
jgi:hypothetical protein